jgi:hypothetical protein
MRALTYQVVAARRKIERQVWAAAGGNWPMAIHVVAPAR